MSYVYDVSEYPNIGHALVHYGPEAIQIFGSLVTQYLKLQETREIVRNNLEVLDRRLSGFKDCLEATQGERRIMQAHFESLIQLARENPNQPEIIKLLLPAYMHLLNSAPNYLSEGLRHIEGSSKSQPATS